MSLSVPRHGNNFNLIRLVFSLLVLLSHAPELVDGNRSRELLTRVFHTLSFGDVAVDGFFLLSGYLIVQSWCVAPRAWSFLRKRVVRIYPGFVVATLVSVFLVAPLGAANVYEYFSQLSLIKVIKGMISLRQPAVPDVFSGQPYALVNGAMWTISYEFKCYLAVLLMGVAGFARKRVVWLAITGCLLLGLTLLRFKMSSLEGAELPEVVKIVEDYLRLASLFFGGACFFLYRDCLELSGLRAFVAAIVVGCGMFSPIVAELMLTLCGGYILFYVGLKTNPWVSGFNKLPDVSYGVYLYGWPVQKLILWYWPAVSPWMVFFLSAMASLVMGAFSWYLIEKPFLRFKGTIPTSATLEVAS